MNKMGSKQKGMTLMELVIALALSAVIVTGASRVIMQNFAVSADCTSHMTAFQQVQNAGYWVKCDAVKAQSVMLDDPDTPLVDEFITLNWAVWDGTSYRVAYTLEDGSDGLKNFRRTYFTFDGIDWVPQESILVAQFIDPDNTTRGWDGSVLTMQIAAQLGDQTEIRTYQAVPRPLA